MILIHKTSGTAPCVCDKNGAALGIKHRRLPPLRPKPSLRCAGGSVRQISSPAARKRTAKKHPEHAATNAAPLLCRRLGALAHSPNAFLRERESMHEAQTSKNTIVMSPISSPAVMLRKLEEKPSRPQRALEGFSFGFSTPAKTPHKRRRQRFLNAFPKLLPD